MLSITEAAVQGIARVRLPVWSDPLDHLKIDILENGQAGPWTHLFSPFNQRCNGRDPVNVLFTNMDYAERVWLPYIGPLPESDEYRQAVKAFGAFQSV